MASAPAPTSSSPQRSPVTEAVGSVSHPGSVQQDSVHQDSADVETASLDYASRFSGPAGQWLLSIQARILHGYFKGSIHNHQEPTSILDVGGGHGQVATAIAGSSFAPLVSLTVLGSASNGNVTLEAARQQGLLTRIRSVDYQVGPFLPLPFPNQSIDIVSSLRFLPHTEHWRELIREMCRVARRAVIVDVPTVESVNIFSKMLFPLKKRVEGNTRTFTLFRRAEVIKEFRECGFPFVDVRGEFFWPMVVHRMLKRPALSEALEAPPKFLGLTDLVGSPVIMRAIRG